jgi:hypothetical protein
MLYSKLQTFKTACIFNLRNEPLKFIRFNLGLADVVHSSLLWIKAVSNAGYADTSNKLFLYVHRDYLELLHFDQQVLKFYNNFGYTAETDALYYILAVMEKLNRLGELCIYGDIASGDSLYGLLDKYVPALSFGKVPDGFRAPASFTTDRMQQYFIEASSLLCE